MKKIHFIICLILLAGTASAQRLTLEEAINIALKNSLDIQLLRNNVESSELNNYIGIAGGLPTVTAGVSNSEQVTNVNQKLNTGDVIERNGAAANNLAANVTAGMLLYNGSRVVATKKRLEQLFNQSEQYVNGQIQNTMAAVMTGYYDIVRQQAYVKTLEQSIDVAQKRLDIVKTQQSVGMANNADLFQSQLDLNTLLQSRQSQVLIVEQAKTDLLRQLNLRPDSTVMVQDTIIIDSSIVLGNVLGSITQNPDVLAADIQIRINELIVREVGAQRYPSLRANAGYNYSRNKVSAGNLLLNQSSGPVVGLSLGIPIYNGTVFKRQQQIAEINVRNATLQRENLARDYASAAVRTYQAYASNLQQLTTQRQNLALARQLLDLTLLRFELRAATIVEVRQAQESFENAAFTMTNLNFAAKSSEIELNRLVSQIKF